MLSRVQKIGENLTVQIPSDYARICGLENGGEVNMRLTSDSIVIESIGHSTPAAATPWREHVDERMRSEMFFG